MNSSEHKMPLLRFRIRKNTDCWLLKNFLKIEVINNEHVLDVDYGVWNFRFFKKTPNRDWH